MSDQFEPAYRTLVVATKSAKRWFDLDAVREPYKGNHKMGEAIGGKGAEYGDDVRSAWTNRSDVFREDRAGAPPLDYWLLDTQAGVDRVLKSMLPERVCKICGEPSRRIVELAPGMGGYHQGNGGGSDTAGFGRTVRDSTTLGWTDCGHNDWRAGVVLDPFDLGSEVGSARYIIADVFEALESLPDDSVDLIFSSPPFLALRSYLPADHPLKDREIGSEATPADFLDTLLDVVEACDRVLAPHGSLVFELGDTYANSGGAGGDYAENGFHDGQPKFKQKYSDAWPLPKSLSGIPTLFAWSLAYGRNLLRPERTTPRWRIRNVVVWARPNPPVGALGDKFRPATSYLTVACKSDRRWFDLDAVREAPGNGQRNSPKDAANAGRAVWGDRENTGYAGMHTPEGGGEGSDQPRLLSNPAGAPPLDYWEIPTQPYPGAHYACVDSETEALTPHGWKRHDQLDDGDPIAAYVDGVIRWEPATFHRYPFHGDLVAIDQRETNQRLTPNHRVLYRTRKDVEHVCRADELKPSHRLPVAAPLADPKVGPGEKLAALLGWYITEGHEGKNGVATIYQSMSANPEKCGTIEGLLDALDATYTAKTRTRPSPFTGAESVERSWRICGSVGRFLTNTAPGKRLTPWAALGWGHAEAEALFDAMILGDGHTKPNGKRCLVQKDRATVDMFQALATRLGFRSTISQRADGIYVVYIGERSWISLRGTNGVRRPLVFEHYEGTVWCPSVDSGFWMARRNGQPFITGNTFPDKLVVKPVKSMCPPSVCRTCGEPRRRIVEKSEAYQAFRDTKLSVSKGNVGSDYDAGRGVTGTPLNDSYPPSSAAEYVTLGWTDCGHNDYRPGVLLDPFCGSGTSLAVATGHGRDAIGIDLDARNAELALERVGPLFLTVETLEESKPFAPPAEDVETDAV